MASIAPDRGEKLIIHISDDGAAAVRRSRAHEVENEVACCASAALESTANAAGTARKNCFILVAFLDLSIGLCMLEHGVYDGHPSRNLANFCPAIGERIVTGIYRNFFAARLLPGG